MTDLLERPVVESPAQPVLTDPAEALTWLARGCIDGEGIAMKLRDLGITGRRVAPGHCPIANYLSRTTGEPMSVTTQQARDFDNSKWDLPVPIPQFIIDFDHGLYPELRADW